MRVEKLSASKGLAWIQSGWRLFRLQPVNYATLVATYVFLLLVAMLAADLTGKWCANFLPVNASLLIVEILDFILLSFLPGLSVGFIEASRTALRGAPIYPNVLFKAFRVNRRTTLALLALGVLQIALILLISEVIVSPKPLASAVDAKGDLDLSKVPSDEALAYVTATFLNVLATIPVYLIFWYAPVLIAWHRMSVVKALFFSAAAVWRNLAAFAAFGLGWMVVGLSVLGTAAVALELVGLGSASMVIGIPLMIMMAAVIYCSVYPTYSTVFVDEDPAIVTSSSSE
ncbi:MAG: BPSS1780 family membrane protein [Burkholderiaceae bacterium]|jgi:hypothetical protein